MCEVDEVLLKLLIKAPLRLGKCTDVCRVQRLGQAIRVDLVSKKGFLFKSVSQTYDKVCNVKALHHFVDIACKDLI